MHWDRVVVDKVGAFDSSERPGVPVPGTDWHLERKQARIAEYHRQNRHPDSQQMLLCGFHRGYPGNCRRKSAVHYTR